MKLTVHNIYDYYSSTPCEKRLYYRFKGEKEAPLSPFEEVIIRLGEKHEKNHINSLGEFFDVSSILSDQQASSTLELIQKHTPIIYQGLLSTKSKISDAEIDIVGIPDIMIYEESGYILRDCKLARHADEKRHPEIILQLQVYGYLYEMTTGQKPVRLEVVLGDSTISQIQYDDGYSAKDILKQVFEIVTLPEAPYSPVGWTKCQDCHFKTICWDIAVKNKDAAIIYGVEQNLARVLRGSGTITVEDLLANYDENSLAELRIPHGKSERKVGKKASGIIRHAKALQEGQRIILGNIALPDVPNFIMFDIEGLPPYLDEMEKIYLWGLQLYGEKHGTYMPALAPIEPNGDKIGWDRFLANCKKIFDENGDIPFIHWHHYEKTKLKLYIDRYGDPDAIAQRVLDNLVDLLPLTKKSMVLPELSYSLKVVERVAGFQRTQDEYGGTWAMAKYIEAVETEDTNIQDKIINDIMKYNEEDLAAMWAVFEWLKETIQKNN